MSDRADVLTEKLRKEFGNVPQWGVASTQMCLDHHDSTWQIKRIYCELADDYNKFRPLARTVHRACKKEIGKLPDVTEDDIKNWILLDCLTDTQIKTIYQLKFDKAEPDMRKAKKLLAAMRRDHGDCHMVGELCVLKWIKNGLDDEAIKGKHQWHIKEAKLFHRAEALRYRLQDELNRREVVSVSEIRNRCREDLNDERIFAHYRERILDAPEVEEAPATDMLPAGAAD
jgi:hypothetical protein